MDQAIRKMQEQFDWINADDASYRRYISHEKAARDELSRLNGAKRDIARSMKADNMPTPQIVKYTGLSAEDISRL
jgi:septation ring formation regulator EzrA